MSGDVLLGDEAVAQGAIDAGISAAFAYPGTPSTEILEFVAAHSARHGRPRAVWAANEKTAFEQALGAAFAGQRALVAMKHVGLNVAADPFVNAALVEPRGGLVVAVADDPGMHSSQNEQDSRSYAEFARIPCFEPADGQQAYDMTREAFEASERFRVPVMLRLVTRLAHARDSIRRAVPRDENGASKPNDPRSWILLPATARRQWRSLLARQELLRAYAAASRWNVLAVGAPAAPFAVLTTGTARNYVEESIAELPARPHWLHLGVFPPPGPLVGELTTIAARILVLENGYPWLERQLRGLVPRPAAQVLGRDTGHLPPDGELTPDTVRAALGLDVRPASISTELPLPDRPPQLCRGCPHADSFAALKLALAGFPAPVVTSDIGCYTLGALPPYCAIQTCVCMGASIGMAKGASEAGLRPAVATIGDSTFLHSGVTALMDCVGVNTDMTVVILDNGTVAMTGGQPTILPSSRLQPLLIGLGVDPAHVHTVAAHPRLIEQNAELLRHELDYPGLSVVVLVRECVETARSSKTRPERRRASLTPGPPGSGQPRSGS